MITVTQKNSRGQEKEVGRYTPEEFALVWWNDHRILSEFSNAPNDKRVQFQVSFDCGYSYKVFCYVAYNDNDHMLSTDFLIGMVRKLRTEGQERWHQKLHYSSRRFNKHGKHRRIRTTQERKLNLGAELDDNYHVRGCRKLKSLPSNWDDQHTYNLRNWKSYRKTQWKPIK